MDDGGVVCYELCLRGERKRLCTVIMVLDVDGWLGAKEKQRGHTQI